MGNTQDLNQVQQKKAAILKGDDARVAEQRKLGKSTARERVAKLLDSGSFVELFALQAEGTQGTGVVTGYGTVEQRPVYVFAQDYTVMEGAMGQAQAEKICKVLDMAKKTGAPVLAMLDSGGVRLEEGAGAMAAYARVYGEMARLSGVCPMIGLVLGPCVGGAAYIAQLCDIAIMARDVGEMMVYGPQVMGAEKGKTYTAKDVGGADVMFDQGAVALVAENEDGAIALSKTLLALLPGCNAEDAPIVDTDDMNRLMPAVDAADGAGILAALMDGGFFIELHSNYGKSLRTALGRLGGRTVGVVCSEGNVDEGRLTAEDCGKAARFIRLCDCYSIPVVSLINSKGVAVPAEGNQGMVLKAVSQLIYAYAEATAPKVSVIVGNAIGQSYTAMGGKNSADMTYAWPGAVISALLPEAAVQLLYDDKLKNGEGDRASLAAEYEAQVADGVRAAMDGMLDDVIDPAQTRKILIASLEMLASKRDSNPPKKHGNLPL